MINRNSSLGAGTPARLRQMKREKYDAAMETAEQTARREKHVQQWVQYENHMAAENVRFQEHPVQTRFPPISKAAKTTSTDKTSTAKVLFTDTVETFSGSSIEVRKPLSKYPKAKQQDSNILELRYEKNRTIHLQQSRPLTRLPPFQNVIKQRSRNK